MIVGITGGIGSGKSTVSRLLRVMGYPVYDSDQNARRLQSEDEELVAAMVDLLGKDILSNGEVNRKRIAEKVFQNSSLLEQLNQLVHPRVKSDFEQWVNHQTNDILFKESALLIETGGVQNCDALVVVMAPEPLRIKRVVQRDDSNTDEVQSRIAKQVNDAERRVQADFLIHNDGQQLLIPQVEQMLTELQGR